VALSARLSGRLSSHALLLQADELGHGVAPSLRAAAPVGELADLPVSDLRYAVRVVTPVAGLPFRPRPGEGGDGG
jgi:hypothetical protein